MKKLAAAILAAASLAAVAQTYVAPHVRRDGTFVDGHFRSRPNNTDLDNYSTRGNTNPYTGDRGSERPSYERPYQLPSYTTPPTPSYGQTCGYTSTGRYICR